MQVGDTVSVCTDNGFEWFTTIIAEKIPSDFDKTQFCFRLFDGAMFYMKPDLETGKRYNVGSRTFWIHESPPEIRLGEEVALVHEGEFECLVPIVSIGVPRMGNVDRQSCYRIPARGHNELFFMTCDQKGRYYSVSDNGWWLERIGRIYPSH